MSEEQIAQLKHSLLTVKARVFDLTEQNNQQADLITQIAQSAGAVREDGAIDMKVIMDATAAGLYAAIESECPPESS